MDISKRKNIRELCQRKEMAGGEQAGEDLSCFIVSYATIIMKLVGLFIYLTSSTSLQTAEAAAAFDTVKSSFTASINKPTNPNFKRLKDIAEELNLDFVNNQDSVSIKLPNQSLYEEKNEQIKPEMLINLIKLYQAIPKTAFLDLTIQINTETTDLTEITLALNRINSVLRYLQDIEANSLKIRLNVAPTLSNSSLKTEFLISLASN